jgi:hypothetical protein
MKMATTSGWSRATWALLALAVGGGLFSGCSNDRAAERISELRDRRQSLTATFASIQNQLRPAQAAALDADGVQSAQRKFYELLRARMIQIDPNAETMLDRARGVGAQLEDATQNVQMSPNDTTAVTHEEKVAIASEFQALERSLVPLQSEAMKYPEVASAFDALQDSVVAQLRLLNPDADVLLDQMREIERELVEIDSELAELEG